MLNIQLSPVVKKLLLLNLVIFLLQGLVPSITSLFSLYHPSNVHFYPFQFFTYMFLHDDFFHLLMNSLPLVFFASYLENLLGEKKFLLLYLVCGIGAGLLHTGVHHLELVRHIERYSLDYTPSEQWDYYNHNYAYMLGASGATFGILMASAMFFPDMSIFIFLLPVPIKMKYLVPIYAFIELYSGVKKVEGDNVAHFAHLGGMIFAFLIIKYWQNKR